MTARLERWAETFMTVETRIRARRTDHLSRNQSQEVSALLRQYPRILACKGCGVMMELRKGDHRRYCTPVCRDYS